MDPPALQPQLRRRLLQEGMAQDGGLFVMPFPHHRLIGSTGDGPADRSFDRLCFPRSDLDVRTTISHYHARGDHVNALAVWDEMQDFVYRTSVHPMAASKDRRKRSIVSSFMPGAGGMALIDTLVKSFGYSEFAWGMPLAEDPSSFLAAPLALRHYMLGGCAAYSSFLPLPHNLRTLKQCGVPRIWLHICDPREAAIAAYHQITERQRRSAGSLRNQFRQAELAGDGDIAAGEVLSPRAQDAAVPDIDIFARVAIGALTDWAEAWLKLRHARPDLVHLTRSSELADPEAVFSRLFAAFDVALPVGELPAFLVSEADRLGCPAWRNAVSAETALLLDDHVYDRLIAPALIKAF